MVWFNVDDTLAFHPKAIKAGNAALGLWVRAGSWSAQTLSDGFIPTSIARSLGTIGQRKALVVAGLWVEVDGGYQFHQWDQKQQTKSDVESRREMERKRKSEQRKHKNVPAGQPAGLPADVRPESHRESHAESQRVSHPESQRESQPPIPSLPFPSSFSGAVEGGSYVSNARENEPPPRSCPDHTDGPAADCEPCRETRAARREWRGTRIGVQLAPSPRCDRHEGVENPPNCGACKDARLRAEQFEAEHRERVAAGIARERRHLADSRARSVADCPLCDGEGYVGTSLCSHDPDQAETARRGMEKVRAALAGKAAAATEPPPDPISPASVEPGPQEPTNQDHSKESAHGAA